MKTLETITDRLTLRERRTKFIEILRTTPVATVCPNFYVLAHANGCLFRPKCEYCYLKSSLWHVKGEEAFSNVDRMIDEVRAWIGRDGLESTVLNTGNLADSLVFEPARPMLGQLVAAFREAEAARRPHALLLVTKGGLQACRPLLQMQPCRNVIVSFSVNAEPIAQRYECGAAATADRLEAARQLMVAGWRVRIRIDPMFDRGDYRPLLDQVADLRPERVTLGMLRAEPNLLRRVNHGLFDRLEPRDGSAPLARYPAEVRAAVFGAAVNHLRPVCPVGLCEETPEIWRAAGLDPEQPVCNCGA